MLNGKTTAMQPTLSQIPDGSESQRGNNENKRDSSGVANSKKRSNAEFQSDMGIRGSAMTQYQSEIAQIEKVIGDMKQRVLSGETLNNFKKEIAQISVLIDRCESQQIFEKTVYMLAFTLQKPEREINLILKRNCAQDKKKKKKQDIDRKKQTVISLIERELKDQNTVIQQRPELQMLATPTPQTLADQRILVPCNFETLEPEKLKFVPSRQLVNLF
jgi:hypothetical protein